MEDVYFERIAGVGVRKDDAGPRMPEGAVPQPQGKPVLAMALDNDVPTTDLDAVPGPVPGAMAEPVADGPQVECDENGFPVSPLRDQEDLWFVQAAALYKPIVRGVGVARASGLLLILSGVLTMLAAAPAQSMGGLGAGLVVLLLGIMDRAAASDLAKAKRSAPLRLAFHQLVIFGLIAGSCWMSMNAVHEEAAMAMEQAVAADHLTDSEMQQVQLVTAVLPSIIDAWFGIVIGVFALIHGGLAVFFASRGGRIKRFHAELPPWVSDIVKTVAAPR